MLRCCRVLWSTLCKISSIMMPSGSWKVSAFTSYKLVVLGILGVLTSMIDTDIGDQVTLPFVLIIGWSRVCKIACAITCPFVVIKCLLAVEYPVPNWYDLCNSCPNIYSCLMFSMITTLSLNTLLPICSWTMHLPTGFSALPPTPEIYLSHGMSLGLMGSVLKNL